MYISLCLCSIGQRALLWSRLRVGCFHLALETRWQCGMILSIGFGAGTRTSHSVDGHTRDILHSLLITDHTSVCTDHGSWEIDCRPKNHLFQHETGTVRSTPLLDHPVSLSVFHDSYIHFSTPSNTVFFCTLFNFDQSHSVRAPNNTQSAKKRKEDHAKSAKRIPIRLRRRRVEGC